MAAAREGFIGEFRSSPAQERLAFLQELAGDDSLYNITVAVALRGALDAGALAHAVDAVVERHEILRTRYRMVDGQLFQVVQGATAHVLETCDAGGSTVESLLAERARRPFNLTHTAPFDAVLLRRADDDHVLAFLTHHFVFDGWSTAVLFRELEHFYRAATEATSAVLPDLAVQYADVAAWQRELSTAGAVSRDVEYWVGTLRAAPRSVQLPFDRPHPDASSFTGYRVPFTFDADVLPRVQQTASQFRCTNASVLLAAFVAMLFRYNAAADIVIGIPVANRPRIELEGLIGLFVNTLAVRFKGDPESTVSEVVTMVSRTMFEGLQYQTAPFEKVVEDLDVERSGSASPLFQTWFNFTPASSLLDLPGLEAQPIELPERNVTFDLQLSVQLGADGALTAAFEYKAERFTRAAVEVMIDHYRTCLATVLRAPETRLSSILSDRRPGPAETHAETSSCEALQTTVDALERHAAAAGGALALAGPRDRLTYAVLNARSNQLAWYLRERGVSRAGLVALLLSSTVESIVALLAIQKLGAPYLPLDPDAPAARIRATCEALHATHVLASQSSPAAWAGSAVELVLLDPEAVSRRPVTETGIERRIGDLAYVIPTSGTTGTPKGVEITHAALANYIIAISSVLDISNQSASVLVSGVAADLGHTVLFPFLSAGGTVFVPDRDDVRDPRRLAKLIATHRPTHLKIVPSHLRELIEPLAAILPEGIGVIVIGGEGAPPGMVQRMRALFPRTRFINHYGPTETTVGATVYVANRTGGDAFPEGLPIGQPLAGVRTYVFNERLECQSIGVPGELFIGGRGLARGYRLRPGLTAESFVPSPFGVGERLYGTGDVARMLPSGDLLLLGRRDRQVKIRGYRVELGEIEFALARLAGQATVRALDAGTPECCLVAILHPDVKSRELEIRAGLRAQLPEYMIPSRWLYRDVLPLTASGKFDDEALRELLAVRADDPEPQADAPTTPAEVELHAIWCEVLNVPVVARRQSFFEIGGHSLSAMRVVARVRDRFAVTIPVKTFFASPTIAELASFIDAQEPARRDAPIRPRAQDDSSSVPSERS